MQAVDMRSVTDARGIEVLCACLAVQKCLSGGAEWQKHGQFEWKNGLDETYRQTLAASDHQAGQVVRCSQKTAIMGHILGDCKCGTKLELLQQGEAQTGRVDAPRLI